MKYKVFCDNCKQFLEERDTNMAYAAVVPTHDVCPSPVVGDDLNKIIYEALTKAYEAGVDVDIDEYDADKQERGVMDKLQTIPTPEVNRDIGIVTEKQETETYVIGSYSTAERAKAEVAALEKEYGHEYTIYVSRINEDEFQDEGGE